MPVDIGALSSIDMAYAMNIVYQTTFLQPYLSGDLEGGVCYCLWSQLLVSYCSCMPAVPSD